jgi:hypothetical protein
MKTIKSRNSKVNMKLLLAALVAGLTLTNPITTITAHAELVDETEDWGREGQAQPETITQQENNEHTEANVQAQENNQQTPAAQDAAAVVDNSQGGQEATQPNPAQNTGDTGNADPTQGEVTNWKDYDPTTDPTWNPIDPRLPAGLPDEVDRKGGNTPNTPTNPSNPSNPGNPGNPSNGTPSNPSNPEPTPIPKTGEEVPYAAAAAAAIALVAGVYKAIKSKKVFAKNAEIDRVTNRK